MESAPSPALVEDRAPVYQPGVLERLRNSRPGQWLAEVAVAASLVGGAAAYEATPVAAEDTPIVAPAPIPEIAPVTISEQQLRQKCITDALARPTVVKAPKMHRAGIRPGDSHHFFTQGVQGSFEYPPMNEACAPQYTRIADGRIQIREYGVWVGRKRWDSPSYSGNQQGPATIFDGPTHAWPDYVFNKCVNGKFQKVRNVLRNRLFDAQTKRFIAEKRYILNVPVTGNCREARDSTKTTEGLRDIWGK